MQFLRRNRFLVIALVGIAVFYLYQLYADRSAGVKTDDISIESKALGSAGDVRVLLPEGQEDGDKRPLLVFLHGRAMAPEVATGEPMERALAAAGADAPIVVAPYGGEASYWHNRESGDWEDFVVDEVIPTVAVRYGADANRVAIGGISMGGYGAFNIASHNLGQFCAVGGHSPAIWTESGMTAEGAFDDAEDFERNDVLATIRSQGDAWKGEDTWIDHGFSDPFASGAEELQNALVNAQADADDYQQWQGEHDQDYWDAYYDEYIEWYAKELKDCR